MLVFCVLLTLGMLGVIVFNVLSPLLGSEMVRRFLSRGFESITKRYGFVKRISRYCWLSLKPRRMRTVMDLKYFKNRMIRKILAKLELQNKRLGEKLAELKTWQEKLGEMKKKILVDDKIDKESITRITGAVADKIAELTGQQKVVVGAIDEVKKAQTTLDTRLEMHEMYRQIGPLVGLLNDESELRNDPKANLAAAHEVVKGVTDLLNGSELTTLSELGVDPADIARNQLKRKGITPVTESTQEIIAGAQRILQRQ